MINVALVQHQSLTTVEANLAALMEKIAQSAKNGAKLVVLQELHNSHYFCQTEDIAYFNLGETIPGPSTEKLSSLCKELNIVLVASLFENRGREVYHNTAVVFDTDGSIAGIYRKMHIPDDPGYYEKFYFTPGDLGFKPIKTSIATLGVLICWDQWFPEAARLQALAGAELLIYPTAIGWAPEDPEEEKQRQLQAWQLIQRSHAISNGIPVLSCNRVGFEADPTAATAGIDFWGHSFVCGPQGETLVQAKTAEEILHCQLDLSHSCKIKQLWPFLRDRRIDNYQELSKRIID